MRILVADDDYQMSESLHRLLAFLGHDVTLAPDSEAALEVLQKTPPDLLLLDWLMPSGGGRRVLQALSRGEVSRVSVLLMTGSCEGRLPPDVSDYPVLYKPFRVSDLAGRLAALAPGHSGPYS